MNPRPVEINKPDHLAHGMKGHTVSEKDGWFVVDVDGVEIGFPSHELLFIEYRPQRVPRLQYWIERFFWFVLGVGFGVLSRMVQE